MEGSLRKLVTRNSWSDRIDVEDETVDSVIRQETRREISQRRSYFIEDALDGIFLQSAGDDHKEG